MSRRKEEPTMFVARALRNIGTPDGDLIPCGEPVTLLLGNAANEIVQKMTLAGQMPPSGVWRIGWREVEGGQGIGFFFTVEEEWVDVRKPLSFSVVDGGKAMKDKEP